MAGRAAIEASRQGARVAMVMKGEFGKSGTSAAKVAEAAGYNVADGLVDREDNPEERYEDILAAAAGTCDERLARIVAEDAPETLRELERMGVPFHMDGERYLEVVGCFASRPRMHIIPGHAEPIVAAQRREVLGRMKHRRWWSSVPERSAHVRRHSTRRRRACGGTRGVTYCEPIPVAIPCPPGARPTGRPSNA